MKRFNYSIIIPHYNIINLLSRCLNSIPDREDIQIIVVDDNSRIAEEDFFELNKFHLTECKFIFNKDSKGAGHARNLGLKEARGKWLLFADADDFFTEIAFDCFDKYIDANCQIVYFDTISRYSDSLQIAPRQLIYNALLSFATNSDTAKRELLKFKHAIPCAKMLRTDVVFENNIKFDEVRYCNDTTFSMLTAIYSKNVFVDKSIVYTVTQRHGSLTTTMTKDAFYIRYNVMLSVNRLLKDNGYAKYQNSLLSYLKIALKINLMTFINAIIMGCKMNAFDRYTLYFATKRDRCLIKQYLENKQ